MRTLRRYRVTYLLQSTCRFRKIKTALMENQIFKKIIFHEAFINNNLCSKIFYAIDILFNDHSSIIILDDEIYPAPQFLKFLNKAMFRYEHQSHVLCVNTSSTTASLTPEHPGADVTFLAEPNGMGFGIWRDRWTKLQFYNDKDASPPQQNTKENRAFLADFLKKSYRQLDAKCITPLIPHSCHCGSEGATCRKSFIHIPAEMRLPLFPNPTHRGQLVTNHLQSKTPNEAQNSKSLNHLYAMILALDKLKHPLLVNVGCGSRFHKDWINLDLLGNFSPVIPWDLHKNLPFPDGSCDAIYSCHSLEHFDQRDAKNLLFECRRVLKPNGILRIVVPDLENIAKTYLGCLEEVRHNPKDKEASARHKWMIIELVDQLSRHESGGVMARTWSQETLVAEDFIHQRMGHEFTNARTKLRGSQMNSNSPKDANQIGTFRLGGEPHQWMYDELSLRELLIQCDFKNITRCEFYQSKIQNFSEYGLDIMPDGNEYRPFSLYIEATP
jgi:predicted SAM-dependent methyltransferase